MEVPVCTVNTIYGNILTLATHCRGSITPADEILIAYALVTEFQTLLGLDIIHGYSCQRRLFGSCTNLIDVVERLGTVASLQMSLSSHQQNLSITHHLQVSILSHLEE